MRIKAIAIIGLVIGFIFVISLQFSVAIDTPHNESNYVSCPVCHVGPDWPMVSYWFPSYTPQTIDDTNFNMLCLSCHVASSGPYTDTNAPRVKTHSSVSMGNNIKYGDWTRECRTCHDPHFQKQKNYKSTDAGNLFLATGTITSCVYNGDNTSTLNYSSITYKTGWDATKLIKKTGDYRRTVLFPNVDNLNYEYPIIAADPGVITVKGNACTNPTANFAVMYGQYVKDNIDISADGSGVYKTVKFFDKEGTKSFADGDTIYNGVCEVCHTQTTHFKNDGSGSDQNHTNIGSGIPETNCSVCHPHTEGFKVTCNVCHGFPPPPLASVPLPTGSTIAGAHVLHATTKGYQCAMCHYNSVGLGSNHMDTKITLGFVNMLGAVTGGTYDGQTTANYQSSDPGTTVSKAGLKECSNIYCHGSTMAPNGGTDITPVWDTPATGACGTCHGATAASPPSKGTHQIHTLAYLSGYNYSCTLCHSGASLHVNNKSEVVFSADPKTTGGSYGGTETMLDAYGTCTNIYCHSTVQSSPPGGSPVYDSPEWGIALETPHCLKNCHKSGHADHELLTTGSHTKHFEYGTEPTCQRCHNYNNQDLCVGCHQPFTARPRDKHANGSIDVAFAPMYGGSAGTYSGAPTPGDAYGSCSNTYCHGKYNGSGLNATPEWGNASSAACDTCHGASNNPDGSPISGSHEKHADTDATIKGVGQAIFNRGYSCTLCHKDIVGGSGPSSYTIADKVKHVSGKVDWKFDTGDSRVSGTSTYSIASDTAVPSDGTTPRAYGTCSNVYCHSIVQTSTGGALTPNTSDYSTVTWGASSNSVNCGNCHKQDGSHYVGAVMDSGSHTKHLSYKFTAASNYMKCELCHSYGVPDISVFECSSCHPTGEKTKHVNGVVNVDFYTSFVGAGGAYNGASAPGNGYSNCSNTYCHSDGTSVSTGIIPDNTSANWGSGALACDACHGNPPAYANGSPKANSHYAHSDSHFNISFTCEKCHYATTTNGSSITNKTNHVNKTYNLLQAGSGVSFSYTFNASGGTCTNISCHPTYTHPDATWGATLECTDCHQF